MTIVLLIALWLALNAAFPLWRIWVTRERGTR